MIGRMELISEWVFSEAYDEYSNDEEKTNVKYN